MNLTFEGVTPVQIDRTENADKLYFDCSQIWELFYTLPDGTKEQIGFLGKHRYQKRDVWEVRPFPYACGPTEHFSSTFWGGVRRLLDKLEVCEDFEIAYNYQEVTNEC